MALLKVHLLKAVNIDYNFFFSPKFHHASLSCSLKEHVVYKLTQQEIFVKSGMPTKIRGKSKRWKEGKNNKLLCYQNQ